MKNIMMCTVVALGSIIALPVTSVYAQEHKWSGRSLDNFEWSIHERLAGLPSYGVFDTVRFEIHGRSVILSGQVTKGSIKHNAERAVGRVPGVERVVNEIEVLPSSRSDDALRMRLYRAIYEDGSFERNRAGQAPAVHIIVKNGWLSLEGVVDSESDRKKAYLRALQVTAQVRDNLRVAPQGS
jgi:hyperosmotically inducible periplasmic protein